MGERTRWSIVKGLPPEQAQAAIAEALAALPGPPPATPPRSTWQPTRGAREVFGVCRGDTLTLCDDAWTLAQEIASRRGLFELELRVQEGDHWDFTLFRGREVVADFSTRVSYFDDDPRIGRPWKLGMPHAFAAAWGIPLDRVAPYLVDWDALPAPRLATPASRVPSGDWREVLDFMDLIGAASPYGHPDRFNIQMPVWTMAPVHPGKSR